VSWTRSPWSRFSVSTAGQAASRRVATSSWAAGRKAAAVQEQTRRRHLLLLLLLLGLGARGRGGGGQDGRLRVLRSLRTARRKIDGACTHGPPSPLQNIIIVKQKENRGGLGIRGS
jgi:hypothetical protein